MSSNAEKPILTKVAFDLPADAPTPTETLWALPLGDGLYKLDNTPWFATGCALNDVVKCEEQPGHLPRFLEVVQPSDNLTVRIFVPDGPNRDSVKEEIVAFLAESGCISEGYGATKGLIAVTIPATIDPDIVLERLRAYQAQGKAYWESGNF